MVKLIDVKAIRFNVLDPVSGDVIVHGCYNFPAERNVMAEFDRLLIENGHAGKRVQILSVTNVNVIDRTKS